MKSYFVTFRSVTHAQRGEQALTRTGYRCRLRRTPRWMEEQGCGYALRLWTDRIDSAVALLTEKKIQLRRVYVQLEEGQMEEVAL